ncbi:hypothetical protein [Oleispirillum naphthae]|uniref:hypothetical protein n=1 Tax=Oleispirillum naphthae TaxID=2838853 RepID=UPI0030826953
MADAVTACVGQVGVSVLGAGVDPATVLALTRAAGREERRAAFLLPFAQAGVAQAIVEGRENDD